MQMFHYLAIKAYKSAMNPNGDEEHGERLTAAANRVRHYRCVNLASTLLLLAIVLGALVTLLFIFALISMSISGDHQVATNCIATPLVNATEHHLSANASNSVDCNSTYLNNRAIRKLLRRG